MFDRVGADQSPGLTRSVSVRSSSEITRHLRRTTHWYGADRIGATTIVLLMAQIRSRLSRDSMMPIVSRVCGPAC